MGEIRRGPGEKRRCPSPLPGFRSPSPGATHRGEEFSSLGYLPMKDAALALVSLLSYDTIVSIYL